MRVEIPAECSLDGIDPEMLASLQILNAVPKESMRVRPPMPGRSFVVLKDDILPLTLTNGLVLTALPSKRGKSSTFGTSSSTSADVWHR